VTSCEVAQAAQHVVQRVGGAIGTAVLAVVLLASGAVLIGAVIGVMAVTRTVMMLQWQRRGRELRQGFASPTTDE